MKYTIQDLAEGKCALKNDGTLEELQLVLKLAFPNDNIPSGDDNYYEVSHCNKSKGRSCWDVNKPKQSVKDFLTIGDLIISVSNQKPNIHQHLIDKYNANKDKYKVQYYCDVLGWKTVKYHPTWCERKQYRLVSIEKYVPFTYEDYPLFYNKLIKIKTNDNLFNIMRINEKGIGIGFGIGYTEIPYNLLFDHYTFADGSVCGKLVTE